MNLADDVKEAARRAMTGSLNRTLKSLTFFFTVFDDRKVLFAGYLGVIWAFAHQIGLLKSMLATHNPDTPLELLDAEIAQHIQTGYDHGQLHEKDHNMKCPFEEVFHG